MHMHAIKISIQRTTQKALNIISDTTRTRAFGRVPLLLYVNQCVTSLFKEECIPNVVAMRQ